MAENHSPETILQEALELSDDQLALAENLVLRIKGGADFAAIAIANSVGARAAQGGLWEDIPRTALERELGDMLFDTPRGELLGPLTGRGGFTIVMVIKKTDGPVPILDNVMREHLRTEIRTEKQTARYEEWLAPFKRAAEIKRYK